MFNEYGASVLQSEKILAMDGGDGCITMYNIMPLNYIFKMVKMVRLVMCILPQLKKKVICHFQAEGRHVSWAS